MQINQQFFSNVIARSQEGAQKIVEKISAGLRINRASDDPAGLAISEKLTRHIDGFSQAARNTRDGMSLVQVVQGDLNAVNDNLQRLRELALQAANGVLNESDRDALDAEAGQIRQQMQDVINRSQFNDIALLSREQDLQIQTGIDADDKVSLRTPDLNDALQSSQFSAFSLRSANAASDSLKSIDQMHSEVAAVAADLGAVFNRFNHTASQLEQQVVSTSQSRSRIRDADIAQEISQLSQTHIREQVGIALQAQANQQGTVVLRLLT